MSVLPASFCSMTSATSTPSRIAALMLSRRLISLNVAGSSNSVVSK